LDDAQQFRRRAEAIMRSFLGTGAVILARAGAAALRDRADVLPVRLFGPQRARIEQAARLERIDVQTAA
jgi:hypothetical protein